MRCAKRPPKGRRWTLEEKVLALAVYKRSPKCYALLQKFIALPSRRNLSSLLEKLPFFPGINDHLFKHIDECLKDSDPVNRMCVLMFDEMAIKEHVWYDKTADIIVGYEDFGNGRRENKVANHALVFMAQGCRRSWKQPMAYYFTRGGVTADKLKVAFFEVLEAMTKANLQVVATVCDMGSANVKMFKDLGSTVQKPYIVHNNKKIFNVYDVCHLLKCTRNLFQKYNFEIPVQVGDENVVMQARWSDIRTAYDIDKNTLSPFRCMYKLTDAHMAPVMQQAMKVKLAAHVMSHTVAAFTYSLIAQSKLLYYV